MNAAIRLTLSQKLRLLALGPLLGFKRWRAPAAEPIENDFIANVSHELRTPLTAIKGASALLQSRDAVAEEDRRYLAIIQANTLRLERMIQDMLDLSAMEAGRMSYDLAPVFPGQVLAEAVEQRLEEAARLGVRLVLGPLPALEPVLGDRERLLQVLASLIDNGLKFTPAGGEVRVTAAARSPFLEVRVSDTGPGIAPEAQRRLFQKFQQLGTTLTSKPTGTGLGLALARQIVEAHGGTIGVESAPGQGSAFRFTLQLVEPLRELEALG